MGRIDPRAIEEMQISTGIEMKRDMYGNPIAYRGRYLPEIWYDNYTECVRENSMERERLKLLKEGRNIHGQTKEQEEAFFKRKKVSEEKKKKAELAAEIALQAR